MPSVRYQRARESLTDDERLALDQWEVWLEGARSDPDGRPTEGRQLTANLRDESHLCGDGGFGDCQDFAEFLRHASAAPSAGAMDADRANGYIQTCQAFAGHGLSIPRDRLPATLLRYSGGLSRFEGIVRRVLEPGAVADLRSGVMPVEVAFARVASQWDATRMADDDRMGLGAVVFATFDGGQEAPRDDAFAMAQSLAHPLLLWPTSESYFFEIAYPTDSVAQHRFPTVADGAWFPWFRPAPEVEPDERNPRTCCGWTNPLGGQTAQPEITHQNQSFRVLAAAPRLLGRLEHV